MTGPGPDRVVDLWVNLLAPRQVQRFTAQQENSGIEGLLGGDLASAATPAALLAEMDRCGVDVGVLTTALSDPDRALAVAEEHPDRLWVGVVIDDPGRPVEVARRLRDVAQHPAVRLARLTPLTTGLAIDAPQHYPVYVTCAELGLPVAVNVGVPGPRVRSRVQHPELLEGVLIDVPEVTVIGAHMGHPYEELLRTYMDKWPQLYLSTTAYLPRYLDPGLLAWMGSRRGAGRVLFGSDHPYLPMARAIEAARALPLSGAARASWLGGTAERLLTRAGTEPRRDADERTARA